MATRREESKALLLAGIVLRVVVFIFLAAGNNDDHTAVVKYFAEHGRLPTLWDTLPRWAGALPTLFTRLMFVPAMLKYHAWSVVRARYLFPAMFACLMMVA